MEGFDKDLNFQVILMGHLGRMSFLLTGLQGEGSRRDMPNQIKAFDLSVEFLNALMPNSLRDENFNKEYTKLLSEAEKEKNMQIGFPLWFHFEKLNLLVDLLDRKGLLTKQLLQARLRKIPPKKLDIKEEFEE